MPELPEVETIRRDLVPLLRGRTVTRVRIHEGGERLAVTHSPREMEAELAGRRVEEIGRHGKYLLLRLDDGRTWVVHLRMTGSLVHTSAEAPAHRFERARIDLDDGTSLRFNDLRKFGTWHLVEDEHDAMPLSGPDALSSDFSPRWLQARLKDRVAPVKALLLDQRIAAGVGNIYADEALWIAKVHPATAAGRLGPAKVKRLHAAVLQTLEESLGDRGSSFSDYRDGLGAEGLHHVRVHVFRREGQACERCGTIIEKTRVAGRGTHFCPRCQRPT
ncbi:MAG: bifunctional DNA-formamidopyrimidine glycosylase/DNA-(apurinic or apyrimidinic site) lyase [Dehalococcoidia bacterium]|nr:bifunctional DNA-formamidopyrimidine glycosylase/DNA-(apurinic or apyrimidinic site) lyase [Dehalococcoidia bacterium]MCA9857235.1 bifunctional DNA-formamidopyrimidine glycosylase/DNA-(apurinic or apyrimidinic site) lyase [Dehalococcoidia bacterium]